MRYFVTEIDSYFRSNGETASTTAKFWQFVSEESAQSFANELFDENFDGFIGERKLQNPNITVFGEGTKNCTIHFRMDCPNVPEKHHTTFLVKSYVVTNEVPLSLGFDPSIPWGVSKNK